MEGRLASIALSVLAVGASVSAQSPEDPPSKREVRELVEVYVSEARSSARREETLQRLRQARPVLAATPINAALRDDRTRGRALALALELRVPGLWFTVKKFIDGDEEDAIVNYGLALRERGAAADVFGRWRSAEFGSTTYGIANAALRRHSLELDTIREAKRYLDSAEPSDRKVADVAAILRFQLGVPRASVGELATRWDELTEEFATNGREFRLIGIDLLRECRWNEAGTVFSVLSNRRLESGADLRLTPTADWNEGSVTVAVRVRVLDGSGTSIGLGTEQGTWEVTLAEDEWVVRNDAEIEHFLKATLGEWVTVKFVVREVRNPNVRGERRCTIHVDDTQLMDNGSLNGRFEHFYVSAGGSTVVVGGAELIRR